ncbi:hypothetical protein AVEN_11372-1 [Araneus ventricosus]|uniref:Uncharacterized protein n=1 Tax=Araneus ventricosus TaxID=182803 RepID=A0A4Y2PQT5_ARAVE|nr:hypothetical protein AVEN_11372-1 [Araneus ventricosus]
MRKGIQYRHCFSWSHESCSGEEEEDKCWLVNTAGRIDAPAKCELRSVISFFQAEAAAGRKEKEFAKAAAGEKEKESNTAAAGRKEKESTKAAAGEKEKESNTAAAGRKEKESTKVLRI